MAILLYDSFGFVDEDWHQVPGGWWMDVDVSVQCWDVQHATSMIGCCVHGCWDHRPVVRGAGMTVSDPVVRGGWGPPAR